MSSTTLGWDRGGPDPPKKEKKIGQSPNFLRSFLVEVWWGQQTMYTFLFFSGEGSNTPDQEIGPPNFELCVCGGNALPAV